MDVVVVNLFGGCSGRSGCEVDMEVVILVVTVGEVVDLCGGGGGG